MSHKIDQDQISGTIVNSVTGSAVNNNDPKNPVINLPNNIFAEGNYQHIAGQNQTPMVWSGRILYQYFSLFLEKNNTNLVDYRYFNIIGGVTLSTNIGEFLISPQFYDPTGNSSGNFYWSFRFNTQKGEFSFVNIDDTAWYSIQPYSVSGGGTFVLPDIGYQSKILTTSIKQNNVVYDAEFNGQIDLPVLTPVTMDNTVYTGVTQATRTFNIGSKGNVPRISRLRIISTNNYLPTTFTISRTNGFIVNDEIHVTFSNCIPNVLRIASIVGSTTNYLNLIDFAAQTEVTNAGIHLPGFKNYDNTKLSCHAIFKYMYNTSTSQFTFLPISTLFY